MSPACAPSRPGRHSALLLAAAAAASVLVPTVAGATVRTWIGPSGSSWSAASNWSPSGAPVGGDTAYVTLAPASAFSLLFDGNYSVGGLASVTFNSASSFPLTVNELSPGASLNAGSEYLGTTGQATFAQSAGTNATSSNLYLAYNGGSHAAYSLSGTGVLSSLSESDGYLGTASFSQSGGTHSASNYLTIGDQAGVTGVYSFSGGSLSATILFLGWGGRGTLVQSGGSASLGSGALGSGAFLGHEAGATGTYSLSGTGTASATWEYVGYSGIGSFAQSGGSHTVATNLSLADQAGSSGNYSLSAGVLSAAAETVGNAGSGAFTQSAGTHSVAGTLTLAGQAGSSAIYSLSGGSLSAAGGMLVGSSANATFNETGGSVAVPSLGFPLNVGYNAGASGTYSLSGSGGLAVAGDEFVGNAGSGTFVQTGGTHVVSGTLCLAKSSGSIGSYSLAGTAILSAGSEDVGYNSLATFTQSGGTHAVSGTLAVSAAGNSGGFYNLSGGYLQAGGLAIGSNVGSFNQTGGTVAVINSVSYLLLGTGSGSTGFYSLSGTGALSAPYEIVGSTGTGSFMQSGGTNSPTALVLGQSGVGGSYSLSGSGVLAATNEIIGSFGQGTFTQSGGTHSVSNSLSFASQTSSTGTYALTAGSLSAPILTLADAGHGTLTQSGGAVSFGTTATGTGAFLANAPGSAAGYFMFGGSLSVSNEHVGVGGTATFFQNSSSTHAVAGSLTLAENPGSSASFTVAGGALSVGYSAFVGGSSGGPGGTATFAMAAGSASIAGDLEVFPGSSVSFSGGTLTVGSIDTSGVPAGLAWSAGTLGVTTSLALNAGLFASSNLVLSSAMALNNSGVLTLAPGFTITGAGPLTNSASGLITGQGAILSPLTNQGTIDLPSGALRLPAFTNAGVVQLDSPSANLLGSTITNSGTLQGQGRVSAAIANAGTIAPTGNGTLQFAASLTNSGTLRIAAGNTLLVTGPFPVNAGSITLTGGTLDTGGQPLSNAGTIQVAGGTSTLAGPLTNVAGSKAIVSGAGTTAVFMAPVTVSAGAEFRVSAGASAVFFAAVTGTGNFTGTGSKYFEAGASEPGFLATEGATTVDAGASLTTAYLREASLTNFSSVALLPSTQGGQPSQVGSLTLLAGSSFDLADNPLTTSTSADALNSYLAAGLLLSSTAAADPNHLHALGYLTTGTSTLVKLALLGDANLDGRVNADDYTLIDRSFARHTSDPHWQDGDFNYDGVVNSADYLLLDTTFGKLSGQLPESLLAQRESQFGPAYIQALTAAVPEPASLCFLPLCLSLFLRRRRLDARCRLFPPGGEPERIPAAGRSRVRSIACRLPPKYPVFAFPATRSSGIPYSALLAPAACFSRASGPGIQMAVRTIC